MTYSLVLKEYFRPSILSQKMLIVFCFYVLFSASENDLELEPRPPVTIKSSRLEDAFEIHEEVGK